MPIESLEELKEQVARPSLQGCYQTPPAGGLLPLRHLLEMQSRIEAGIETSLSLPSVALPLPLKHSGRQKMDTGRVRKEKQTSCLMTWLASRNRQRGHKGGLSLTPIYQICSCILMAKPNLPPELQLQRSLGNVVFNVLCLQQR